ncbi:MAG: hypothetical protein HY653_06810 [Acidobacteria bacterium]|nr:hypothetical protein [Acidobacteriota bacterium]
MKTYKPGQHVRHSLYGIGTILTSNEERTAIDFRDHGAKLFVTSLVQLAPATAEEAAPPPKKPRRARPRPARRRTRAKVAAH